MQKITFVNENAPYVSAENLNQMQTNVENAINGIVESGSNENGTWIKWANGTLICRITDFLTTNKDEGGYFQYANWTYPVAFVGEIPTITATPKHWTARITSIQVNPTLNNCDVLQHFMNNNVNPPQLVNVDASPVCVTAIGRWK